MGIYEEIIEINKELGGTLVRPSSLHFACDIRTKNIYRKLACIIRAIVVDHPFSDYNKSSTMIFTTRFFKREKINGDKNCIENLIRNIAIKNIIDIKKIEKRLRKCYPKKK